MAALTADNFGALQSLLKASSKDVVRHLCQESFSSSAVGSKELLDNTCSSLSVTQEEAEQLLQALHRLTRLAAFRDLSSAEAVLALFPASFHQNLKNLLTKIILENILSATPGGPGLESGHQNRLRQHQPHGGPHLPAPDEDQGRSQAVQGQPVRLSCHHGAEQGNAGHYVRRAGPHPGPAFCRGQQMTPPAAVPTATPWLLPAMEHLPTRPTPATRLTPAGCPGGSSCSRQQAGQAGRGTEGAAI
ncbi:PREDICTED: COMM domain-containing protein 9 isoform X2 [Myotis davidii]|uniref:COMM domain-containing protein 9 isoform X2 n=1 Tax=Myotis davidii TaxID=225400 RepID=UPI0007670162|nr:PREDICTED: COMM domain-containing protein 9 isoform X2 [Myotis davidii]